MYRRINLGTSKPDPAFAQYLLDGFRFTRTDFLPGMWVATRVTEPVRRCDWESVHIQATGHSFEEGGERPWFAGYISREDTEPQVPSEYKRIFDQPSEVWCGLWTDQRAADDLEGLLIEPGEQRTLLQGRAYFLVHGAVEAAGKRLKVPRVLRIKTGDRTVTAVERSFLFGWPDLT